MAKAGSRHDAKPNLLQNTKAVKLVGLLSGFLKGRRENGSTTMAAAAAAGRNDIRDEELGLDNNVY